MVVSLSSRDFFPPPRFRPLLLKYIISIIHNRSPFPQIFISMVHCYVRDDVACLGQAVITSRVLFEDPAPCLRRQDSK